MYSLLSGMLRVNCNFMKYGMSKTFLLFWLVMSGLCASTTSRAAEFDVTVVSAHVWRGLILNDAPCIQPSIDITAKNFGLNVWGTWDLTDDADSTSRSRMDVTLDYTQRSGMSVLKAGFVSYIYHDDSSGVAEDTYEGKLNYSLDVPTWSVLPFITINYDFGEIDGVYYTFGIESVVPLREKVWDMDLYFLLSSGDADYVNYNFNSGEVDEELLDAALIDFEIRASLPYKTSKNCTITPEIRYMMLLDPDIKDAVEESGMETEEIVYSISMAIAF